MTKPVMTPKTFFNALSIMHLAFFGSLLGFAAIAYYLTGNHNLDIENTDTVLLTILVMLSIFGISGGNIIKKKYWKPQKQKKP